jgi:hypothetical protein
MKTFHTDEADKRYYIKNVSKALMYMHGNCQCCINTETLAL